MVTGVIPRKILAERGGVPAHGLNFSYNSAGIVEFFSCARMMNGQTRARARKSHGYRAADLATGAGDQGGAASQTERLERIGHDGTPRCGARANVAPHRPSTSSLAIMQARLPDARCLRTTHPAQALKVRLEILVVANLAIHLQPIALAVG